MCVMKGVRCDSCGRDVFTRQQVLKVVEPPKFAFAEALDTMWRVYQPGASVATGCTGKDDYDESVLRVACNCETAMGVSASMRMVREQYRQLVSERMGDQLTLPLLFSLPTDCVAWENTALVSVKEDGTELVLSDTGMALAEIMAQMSEQRLFRERVPFSHDDLVDGYSYLYLIRRDRRAVVATHFGPKASLAELFADLPMSVFDWQAFPTMSAERREDGVVVFSKTVGASLVVDIAKELGGKLPSCQAVVPGSFVLKGAVCVQAMPRGSDAEGMFSGAVVPDVHLEDGLSFLPLGRVVLSGQHKAITVEPGIAVVMEDGAVVHSTSVGLTLFVNGSVCLKFVPGDDLDYRGDHVLSTAGREYSVAVRCESYGASTLLGWWYRRQLDVLSTEARFFVKSTSLLLLCSPHVASVSTVPVHRTVITEGYETGGVSVTSLVFNAVTPGAAYRANVRVGAVGMPPSSYDAETFVVNGCITLPRCSTAVVGSVSGLVVALEADSGLVDDTWAQTSELTVRLHEIGDAYYVDDGGPSGDDGEFFDDTGTSVTRFQTPYLSCLPALAGDLRTMHDKFSFTMIARDPIALIRAVGYQCSLKKLVSLNVDFFCESALDSTGLRLKGRRLAVVSASDATYTWKQCAMSLRYWHDISDYDLHDTLARLLRDKFVSKKDQSVLHAEFYFSTFGCD